MAHQFHHLGFSTIGYIPCNQVTLAGRCFTAPKTCKHRNCTGRDCNLNPSEIAGHKGKEVTPSLYATVQFEYSKSLPPEKLPYGKFLVHFKKNEPVAHFKIDHFLDKHEREYKDLTLRHQWVTVNTYKFDTVIRDFTTVKRMEWIPYGTHLDNKKCFTNWKAEIVDMWDRFGRRGHDADWRQRFEDVIAKNRREVEEWKSLPKQWNMEMVKHGGWR
ncbi:hypothetical protein K458DRAFT_384668 [Lentithecium fluviatile CBS 122367]|uniref:Uncharacterized protein n=1 Tax=Lentithecium fluviatile CBS 122367 TaxID=1168545 RepID=A0A6G1JEB8_9PLEO|nr:hypothetical protein K458DRAFT_384668 [Lentithecium fluviatile CBS 122367]